MSITLSSPRRAHARCSITATVARHYGAFERPEPIAPAYLKPVDGKYIPPIKPLSIRDDGPSRVR